MGNISHVKRRREKLRKGEISTIKESKAVEHEVHPEIILKRLILVCIAITTGISGIAILGWMLNWLILARISSAYIPMAFSTALMFMVISGVMFVYIRQPVPHYVIILAKVGVYLVLLASLIISFNFLFGMTLDIEGMLINSPEKFGDLPINHMSPISAANFLLAGLALLLLLVFPGNQRARAAAAYPASIVFTSGLLILLGYLYGTPLLYGGTIIPVALTTAIAFVFMGTGLITAVGQDYWPINSFSGSSVRARLMRTFLPLMIAIVVINGWFDITISPFFGNHVVSISMTAIFSIIIAVILFTKTSTFVGKDFDRADTLRLQAEKALRESKALLDSIVENVPLMIFLKEAKDLRFVIFNRAGEELLGYDRKDLLGKSDLDFFSPEQAAFFMAKDREVLDGELGFLDIPEEPINTANKGERLLHTMKVCIRGADGAAKYLLGISEDITESKQSELEYQTILKTAMDGFYVIDLQGRILDVNDSYCSLVGYSRDELLKKGLKDIEASETEEIIAQRIRHIIEVGGARFETRHKCKDGGIIEIEASVNYMGHGSGKFYCFMRDITERKKAEENLRDSEERYRRLVDFSPYGIAIHSEGKFVYMNLAGAKILGTADASVFIGKPVIDVIHPEHHEIARERIRMQAEGKMAPLIEELFLRIDGTPVYVEIISIPFTYQGKPAMYGVFSDITEQKKAQALRIENERLAAADQAKSEFFANMSHELRTPLNTSIGFSELLAMGKAGELSEKQKKYVDNILISNQFLLTLINDILDISKIEAGKIELVPEKMSVPVTIKETLSLLNEKAMVHNVLLETEFDPELEFIEADKQRFKQVLFNILSNALKFSKEDGGTINITAKKEGDLANISISDTGIGIKEENIGKLFQKFEQLDSGISIKYGGTGLGLAITKQLVELQGGRIWAESRYGEGSTFTFLIPIIAKKTEGT